MWNVSDRYKMQRTRDQIANDKKFNIAPAKSTVMQHIFRVRAAFIANPEVYRRNSTRLYAEREIGKRADYDVEWRDKHHVLSRPVRLSNKRIV